MIHHFYDQSLALGALFFEYVINAEVSFQEVTHESDLLLNEDKDLAVIY